MICWEIGELALNNHQSLARIILITTQYYHSSSIFYLQWFLFVTCKLILIMFILHFLAMPYSFILHVLIYFFRLLYFYQPCVEKWVYLTVLWKENRDWDVLYTEKQPPV